MCGRFTLTWSDYNKLVKELEVPPDNVQELVHSPRFNIAPAQEHWIVKMEASSRRLERARWGWVRSWAKDKRQGRLINVRSEKADVSPAFEAAFTHRRCVVPADGFFEWTGNKGRKRPLYFHPTDRKLLLLAGLYEADEGDDPGVVDTFTILTTVPNATVGWYHQRMPVILAPQDVDFWLSGLPTPETNHVGQLKELLRPAADDRLEVRPVSDAVNQVHIDEPTLIEEVEPIQGMLRL